MIQSDDPFLIIGGVTKSGTTSIFSYLSDHPQVKASALKETRYFLDADYPLPSRQRISRDPLATYLALFVGPSSANVAVEATPDYLYSVDSARLIEKTLLDAKLLFVLREPVSRLKSWYRFSQQNGWLDVGVSFSSYVDMQRGRKVENQPQYLRAWNQGFYAEYLDVFLQTFGPERCALLRFEDLCERPRDCTMALCRFRGLEPSVYENYEFSAENVTQSIRNAAFHRRYLSWRYRMRNFVQDYPLLHKAGALMRRLLEPVYLRVNKGRSRKPEWDPTLDEKLAEDYAQDQHRLQGMFEEYGLLENDELRRANPGVSMDKAQVTA